MTLPTIADCIKAVADVSGVRVEDILGEQRHKPLVIYRQVAMYLAHQKTCQSLPTIGRSFHRDHTTVLHGVRRIKKEIGSNEDVDSLIRQASAILAAQEAA